MQFAIKRSLITTLLISSLLASFADLAQAGVIAVAGEGGKLRIAQGGVIATSFIASLGPRPGAGVTVQGLAHDPLTNQLYLLTNGGLFRREADGSFFDTHIVEPSHGYDALSISGQVPEPESITILSSGFIVLIVAFRQRRIQS